MHIYTDFAICHVIKLATHSTPYAMKVLVAEEESLTASLLAKLLSQHHFSVNVCRNSRTGLALATTYEYDLILLAEAMPEIDGIEFCRRLREQGVVTPLLMLATRDSSINRVQGLEAGADDYLIKPFDETELLARVWALLRRERAIASRVLRWEYLQLDLTNREVRYDGRLVKLTPKELGLLELFLRYPRRTFSRSNILDRVWQTDECPGDEAVRTQIMGLRQKLKSAGLAVNPIETVYGQGYRLRDCPIKSAQKPEPATRISDSPVSSRAASHIAATNSIPPIEASPERTAQGEDDPNRLEQAQTHFQHQINASISWLERVWMEVQSTGLQQETQQQATQVAQQLVNLLATVGAFGGLQVARTIESLLAQQPFLEIEALYLEELIQELRQTIAQGSTSSTPSSRSPAPTYTSRTVLSIGLESPLLDQLEILAPHLQVTRVGDLVTAQQAIIQTPPDLILLGVTTTNNRLQRLGYWLQDCAPVPILAIADRGDLNQRVAVARLGGRGFLQRPVTAYQLYQAIVEVLPEQDRPTAKILAVDDDPFALELLKAVLTAWGFQVTALVQPQQFWEMLETTRPDLLILDFEMPGFNGVELCQAVRNDPQWSNLPILFLSAHRDSQTICRVYSVGADDYVNKPIVESELMVRILNRLRRQQRQPLMP